MFIDFFNARTKDEDFSYSQVVIGNQVIFS